MTPPQLPQIPPDCHAGIGVDCPDKVFKDSMMSAVSAVEHLTQSVREMREDFRDHVKEQADLIKTLTVIDTHVARYLGNARRGELFEEIGEIKSQLKEHHDYITARKTADEVEEKAGVAEKSDRQWMWNLVIPVIVAVLTTGATLLLAK